MLDQNSYVAVIPVSQPPGQCGMAKSSSFSPPHSATLLSELQTDLQWDEILFLIIIHSVICFFIIFRNNKYAQDNGMT